MDNFIIYRIQFLYWQKKKYSNERLKLLGSINNIMNRISESFDKNIINQYYFNLYLEKLEKIHEKYKKIYKVTLLNLKQYRVIINNLKNELIELSKKTGLMNISSITSLNYCLDVKDLEFKDKNIIEFVDLVFNPTGYELYDLKYKNKNNNELTIYNSNDNSNSSITNDLNIIMKLDNISFTKLTKKNTLLESVNGTRIYISVQILQQKYALVVDGYFKNDPLNISRYNGFIFEKQKKLINAVKNLIIDDTFKYGYIDQISIRDFLIYDIGELVAMIKEAYEIIHNYKKKNISQIVKEFLNKPLEKQRDLLTYFLLCDDSEFQYFAFLLYDMISNETYLLKAQPLADQLFSSIHWTIQRKFKNIVEKVDKYTQKLLNVDDNISYEKRICLMKVNDNVKHKAIEKLKEINNKNSENCSKAQQYLDSLLKIPFGVYRKEKILNSIEIFKLHIDNFVIAALNKFTDEWNNLETIDGGDNINKLYVFIKKYYNYNWKYNNIELFIKKLSQLLCNTIDDISVFLINNIKKIKVSDLKLIIDLINQDKNEKLLKKGNKKTLINNLSAYIHTNDLNTLSNENKLKVAEVIQSNIKKQEDKNNNIFVNVKTEIKEELEIISGKWQSFKNGSAEYMNEMDKKLDNSIYGQYDAKNEIKRIVAQWINGENSGYCLGFEGPPGTGKTSLAKYGIAECLKDDDGTTRPFSFIALGGSSNGSTLEGHNYTYVGSTYGKIVEILIDSKCMNPIIFIDELDKISNTDNGRELIGILTHLTDSTQNDQFMDKYFSGISLDLSKVLFIFSYNDYNLLDSILADRIHRVKFNYLKVFEKIHIIDNYLVPKMLNIIGFDTSSIKITKEAVEFIIKNYTYEAGVRRLKERIIEILRQINLECITSKEIKYNETKQVDLEYVEEFFKDRAKICFSKIHEKPKIGLVNGLFATSGGVGGITVIEAFKTPSDSKLSLITTGKQGEVMKESITCSKTIAWNVIPTEIKNTILKEIKDGVIQPFGIHIHCPEAATPKDGPSAGAAITLAMVSLLINVPVNNKIALTGEIDLNGTVHTIGGLELKIEGGKWAGVEKFLIPSGNKQDLDIIKLKNPGILEGIEIVIVDNIWQVLDNMLMLPEDFQYSFNNYS